MPLEDFLPEGVRPPEIPSDREEFWRFYWDRDVKPWDLGEAHPEMRRRSEELRGEGRALVPGCGLGHDALMLAGLGWQVDAVDFAAPPAGLDVALAAAGGRFLRRDVFQLEGEALYDLWLEHTFYCAVPPERRADWGRLAARLLRPRGRLAALVFPVGKPREEGGPPYGVDVAEMSAALGSGFEIATDEEVVDRAEGRGRAERWAVWRRI